MFICIQEKCGLKNEKLADFNYRDPRACYHHTGPWFREAGTYIYTNMYISMYPYISIYMYTHI
jgi:hypothetical protein